MKGEAGFLRFLSDKKGIRGGLHEYLLEIEGMVPMVREEKEPRILVPVDGSEGSDAAVVKAGELALALGGCLDILHVSYFDSTTDAEEDSWLPDIVAGAVGKEQRSVIRHSLELLPPEVTVESWQRTGTPATEILKFAQEQHDSLIVIGGRGLGLMEGLFLGSVSQKVVEESRISVLVVKAGEQHQPEPEEKASILPDISRFLKETLGK